jgi:16S rRNA processing protein RimM
VSPCTDRSRDDRDERLLSVGRIVKPHGLQGEVVVDLTSNRPERLDPGSELEDPSGRIYRVVRSRRHKARYLVTFEGLATIGDAEDRRDTELLAHPVADPDALWVHDLVGSRVEDSDGRVLGVVTEVQANPASDLLVLDGGGLVPLRFVVDTVPGERVVVSVPDGLLELG